MPPWVLSDGPRMASRRAAASLSAGSPPWCGSSAVSRARRWAATSTASTIAPLSGLGGVEHLRQAVARREPHAAQEAPRRSVGAQHAPAAVEREGRIGVVTVDHPGRGAACEPPLGLVRVPGPVGRGEARGEPSPVARRERPVGLGRMTRHHRPAEPGSARLEERDMARRDLRTEREVELARPAARPQVPRQRLEALRPRLPAMPLPVRGSLPQLVRPTRPRGRRITAQGGARSSAAWLR